MAKKQGPKSIEMTEEELNALRERIQSKQLTEDDYSIFEQTIQFVVWVQFKLEHAKITMSKFKNMLFGPKTEKKKRSKNGADSNPKNEKQEETNLAENQDMNNSLLPSNTQDDLKKKN